MPPATRSAPSSTKSATSLPSLPSPAPPAPPAPSAPRRSTRAPWAWVAGLVVTAALLYWTLHDVDPGAVLGHIRRAHPFLLMAAVAPATLPFPLRTARWRLILRDVDGHRFPWLPLWHATAPGFLRDNLLPVCAGAMGAAQGLR